jgi:hypothetical protein
LIFEHIFLLIDDVAFRWGNFLRDDGKLENSGKPLKRSNEVFTNIHQLFPMNSVIILTRDMETTTKCFFYSMTLALWGTLCGDFAVCFDWTIRKNEC